MTKNSLRTIAFCSFLTALAASSAAQAQVYFRADLGYSKSTDADFKDKNFSTGGLICGDAFCDTGGSIKDVDNSFILSGGAGYRFTRNVRADVILGYRPGYQLDASDVSTPPTKIKADVKSWSLMANGYYDFPLTGWTPYVGAGLGVAQNKVGTVSFDDGAGFAGSVPGGTKTGVAWALMAGAGIRLSNRLTLDVGYRYIDLGKLETDSGLATFSDGGFAPYSGATGKLKAHELTVGLRF